MTCVRGVCCDGPLFKLVNKVSIDTYAWRHTYIIVNTLLESWVHFDFVQVSLQRLHIIHSVHQTVTDLDSSSVQALIRGIK